MQEAVVVLGIVHFHIRWSGSGLDWQVFVTAKEAESAAQDLVLPGESFTVEEFGGNCPRCAGGRKGY
jgi:hypothetical protein